MHNIYGGGENTNKNGLIFEKNFSLDIFLNKKGFVVKNDRTVWDNNGNFMGYSLPKHCLYKDYLEEHNIDYKKRISKKWLPDDAFLNVLNNTLYIIEIKYQQVAGSVDEKLPNCEFKKEEYEKLFGPNCEVEFIYILSNWFSNNRYKDTLDYIKRKKCKYFIADKNSKINFSLKDIGL